MGRFASFATFLGGVSPIWNLKKKPCSNRRAAVCASDARDTNHIEVKGKQSASACTGPKDPNSFISIVS